MDVVEWGGAVCRIQCSGQGSLGCKFWAAENGRCDPMAAWKPKVEFEVALAVSTPPTKPSNAPPSGPRDSSLDSFSAQGVSEIRDQGRVLPRSSDTRFLLPRDPVSAGVPREIPFGLYLETNALWLRLCCYPVGPPSGSHTPLERIRASVSGSLELVLALSSATPHQHLFP